MFDYKEINTSPKSKVRALIRNGYSLQRLRVQAGNRICAAYRTNLGINPSQAEDDVIDAAVILKELRDNYNKITDGIKDIPNAKRFSKENLATGLIKDYAEFTMMESYVKLEELEDKLFKKDLKNMLSEFPIYNLFLSKVEGCGDTMAGILISEIDISLTPYSSSLHMYCGLDVVNVNNAGNEDNRGRGRYKEHMVEKEIVDEEGNVVKFMGLSHKPFLKTKLISILGPGFIKCQKTLVDGLPMSSKDRELLAIKNGLDVSVLSKDPNKRKEQVINYLNTNGNTVIIKRGKYGQIYHDYKIRQQNKNMVLISQGKEPITPLHIHNRSIRYAVKRFLTDFYFVARTIEGLPVTQEYSVRKLGLNHNGVLMPVCDYVKSLVTDKEFIDLCNQNTFID